MDMEIMKSAAARKNSPQELRSIHLLTGQTPDRSRKINSDHHHKNMKSIKKNILLVKALAIPLFCIIPYAHASEKTAHNMIEGISKESHVVENEIVITMKNEGQRFLFTVDDSKPRVLDYGEVIRLKPGFKKASFKSRGRSLVITSSGASPAEYSVSEVIDTRSLGGERNRSTRSFKIIESRMQESTPEEIQEQNKAQHPTDGAVVPDRPEE